MKKVILLFLFLIPVFTIHAQQQDSIVLPNAVLYYYTYGSGNPVVILSGGPGIASHQEDDLAKKLSSKYKAILFDQRGTGKSWTKPFDSTTINLQTAVNDIEILRKNLHIDKLVLAGHSWGAMLATAYVAKYPSRVKAVMLIGGGEIDVRMKTVVDENVAIRFPLCDTSKWYYWNDPAVMAKDSVRAKYEIRKMNWSMLIYDQAKLDSVMAQASHGAFSSRMNDLMWQSLRKEQFNAIEPVRKNYKGKSLIVLGWQDPIALTTLSLYQQAYPKAITKGINQCGHMPGVEQPEEYYKILFAFLEEVY